jgi:hypothetical protein
LSKNGTELFGILLPNFCNEFQKYIDDGTILSGKNFTNAGSTRHVSAHTLTSSTPPGSVLKALHPSHPDKSIWFESYQEEYEGLISNDTFDIISEAEYQRLKQLHGIRAIPSMRTFVIKHTNGVPTRAKSRIVVIKIDVNLIKKLTHSCKGELRLKQLHGVRAIPSMCTFVIKHTNGVPTRAKSRIVVLGNFEQRSWTKADCFSPVISIPMIRLLTAMAVQRGRTLKQADCKFAFIQTALPPDEHTIVKPPLGCPFSKTRQYWRLKKSLYGLRCAPRHWYNKLKSVLESPEIGLTACPQDSCLFHGILIPGKPPIYVTIYVDDIIFFSTDDEVEKYFCTALSQKIKVEFLGDAKWYFGIKFDWHPSSDGTISCRLSQEGYAAAIVEEMGLSSTNKCPMMTPF